MELKKVHIVLIILLVIFSIPFIFGIEKIISSDNYISKLDPNIFEQLKIHQPTSLNLVPNEYYSKDDSPIKKLDAHFDSLVVFPHDEISMIGYAEVTDPKITQITFIVKTPDNHFEELDSDADTILNRAREYHQTLDLYSDSDPPFRNHENIPVFKAGDQIGFDLLIIRGDEIEHFGSSDTILTVYSEADRLQIQTNLATLEQIKQFDENSRLQHKTNNIFIGLTLIVISGLPIGITSDIFIRLYGKDKPSTIQSLQ